MPATWVFHTCKPLLCFPNSAALNSANFANKKLVRFFTLFITSNILLGFGGFFNCQKVQKCFISLETSKTHTFKIIICLFWWGFLLVFPEVGDFHCSCALSYFPFQRGEAGWSYLPRRLSEVQGTQLSYTTTEISLETFSKHCLAERNALTISCFSFIFHCGISSENQGN